MDEKEKKAESTGQLFVIDIKSVRNDTWQGRVEWVQEQKTVAFRSTLELIRLLDSAIETSKMEEQ